ncbi:hypothetical protein Barb4_00367 [Bacteroidales bacterium Barb4]|nr:hypothetical protein Barb4_00367 [Bacteroidales bacterium Barb4]
MVINKQIHFGDLSKFWNYAMQDSNARRKSSRDNNNIGWSGGLTWEQAKQMAISGWRDGMNEIEKYRAKIVPIVTEKVLRPKQVYSLAGYSVDVGSFLANDPECFIAREYEERNYPGKIYKIVASISFSAAIKPETIIQRGAMICALIDAIEFAGHRAEVICNDASSVSDSEKYRQGKYKEGGWFEVSVTVKKVSQPLEMSDLAFCLAHPAMLRRIMFSVAELQGWSDFANNYGCPAEATDKGDIYIREIYSETVPDEHAITWVLTELGKLGIDIETN